MSQVLSTIIEHWDQVIYDRRQKPNITALSWMNRREEDKLNLCSEKTLNLSEAEILINQAVDSTKGEWEAIFILRGIIEDLSKESKFSEEFFKKFDYYSKKYISLFYRYLKDLEENYSLIFSKLNTVFQERNIDIEIFEMLSNYKNNLYPEIEIRRTFIERIEDVLKYHDILLKYKNKIDNLLKCRSLN